ncbi:MAG TPA: serine/threonine protein kinase, partial [Sorangium sp.]|nr:serine/threonine protein kinase [Sorangium sp.]
MSGDTQDPLELIGKTIADKYLIKSIVGAGGFSTVYRAEHLIWKQDVAIKCFTVLQGAKTVQRDQLLEDFIQEGKLMSELSSRSAAIVQARDIGKLEIGDGQWVPFMVLEWIDGKPLNALLADERNSGMPARTLADALVLLEPVAVAVDMAHRRNVAHRDLKPANIMVVGDARSPDVVVKVLDFGIAKIMANHEQLHEQLKLTGQQITAFTPNHGAPEQFSRNYGATGPWTDVYAMALIVVEVVRSGLPSLQGSTFYELGVASCDDTLRPTPRTLGLTVSDEIEAIFARAVAVRPEERYATMGEFWTDLHAQVFPDQATWRGNMRHTVDPKRHS